MLPLPIKNLIDQLSKLPEIGPRAATRLAFFMINQPEAYLKQLAQAIQELKIKTKTCKNCFNLASELLLLDKEKTEVRLCNICSNPKRDQNIICVVEDILDILPFERLKRYNGVYHVLGGLIAPIEGITPDKLHIKELAERIKRLKSGQSAIGGLSAKTTHAPIEIIIALNPTTEGDTTTLYLERTLKPLNIKITRLGRGLSTGSDLEYTDETTLINALLGRK